MSSIASSMIPGEELPKKIAGAFGDRWVIHNCYPCSVSASPSGVTLSWNEGLGLSSCVVKAASVVGPACVTENNQRYMFRFRHNEEGEIVLSCLRNPKERK